MDVRNRRVLLIAVIVSATLLAGTGVRAGELVINGGFETGSFGAAWVHGAYLGANTNPNLADHAVMPDLPYAGNYSALLGFKYVTQATNATGYMYQTVTIPANVSSAALYFKVRQQGYDSTPYDPFRAQIRSNAGTVLQTILTQTFPEYNYQFKDSGWLDDNNAPPVGFNMAGYAGQTIRIYFEQANTIDALYETWAYVDDVSLIYRMWVDLAVNGNGNDVFGAPGSGNGGFGERSGVPGDTLAYQVVVENEGTVNDGYTLALSGAVGPVWIDNGSPQAFPFTTPVIPTGTSQTYEVYVVIPSGTPVGSYDLILNATSTAQGSRNDSARLRWTVTPGSYDTDLVVNGNGFGVVGDNGTGGFALMQAPWDSTVTYALEIFNTGDAATTFNVSMTPDAGVQATIVLGGTPYTMPFVTPSVPAGGSVVMTLQVLVPSPRQGGDHATIVQAAATSDPLKKDTIKAVLRLRAPRLGMIIGTSGNGIYDDTGSGLGGSSTASGGQGTSVYFPVTVQNESAITDSFTLDWSGPIGWTASLIVGGVTQTFPFTTPAIAAFSQVQYTLRVNVPNGAAYATFATILDADSETDNRISDSVSANISVSDASQGVDMVIDGQGANVYGPKQTGLGGTSVQYANPGDTVLFAVDLLNLAGPNAIDIDWIAPAGWTVLFDGAVAPITGHPDGSYLLMAVVPAASTGGTFDIILDAEKSDEPFYNDSVTGRVVVTPPLIVDGIIDGNGDDVFGAPGTGLGGLSSQTRSAPSTLSFTLELWNQGPSTDSYTITWNAVPSWTATLDAQLSPVTTNAIAAGGFALYTFQVVVPAGAYGANSYFIDIVSNTDGSVAESVEARISVVSPPRADFVIDGNGAGAFGAAGTGSGGTSVVGSTPGSTYASTLELRNVGSYADSFYVDWGAPAGWPAGSVTINDGIVDHAGPFWSVVISPSGSATYTVIVQVPVSAGSAAFVALFDTHSSLPPNTPESAQLITLTQGTVTGVVFEDRDQNGVFSAGDAGLAGVQVRETATGQIAATDAAGRYIFDVPSGTNVTVIEQNPSGFVSLSPDTVGPAPVLAGDTLTVDFADVLPLRLSAGSALTGIASSYVDFPHRLDAATIGQVTLTATAGPGVTTTFMLDANGNGVFDGGDGPLQPSDIDMDPPGGKSTVYILVRVFIPADFPVGTTSQVTIDATQSVGAPPVVLAAQAIDAVVGVDNTVGRVTLQKDVDLAAATPGQQLTYTITFFNAGTDSVQNVVLADPVSAFVDPVPDAFGPGLDVEWQPQAGPPVYLTLASDADECDFDAVGRILRLVFSKNTPYYLPPGVSGVLTYRVVVR